MAHEDPVLAAADSYSYLHLVLVAGIIVFAVGARNAVAHVNDPLSAAARLALCGGIALYLAGHVAFRLRMVGTLSCAPLAAAVGCLFAFALDHEPAWVTAGAITLVLALQLAWEAISERPMSHPGHLPPGLAGDVERADEPS